MSSVRCRRLRISVDYAVWHYYEALRSLAPMDPFSISVGVVTLIGLASQVVKSAEKLRAYLKTNDQVCALINELTDLRCVLTAADADQGPLSLEKASHLQSIIGKANEKLSSIELIINERLLKAKSPFQTPVPSRTAWLREKGKIEVLQKDLRYLTSAFSLALTASTSGSVNRVELAVTALATLADRSNDAESAFRGATEMRFGRLDRAM